MLDKMFQRNVSKYFGIIKKSFKYVLETIAITMLRPEYLLGKNEKENCMNFCITNNKV